MHDSIFAIEISIWQWVTRDLSMIGESREIFKRGLQPLVTTFVHHSVRKGWVEFIGVLRHMQQYFSHICDGTDVQADWWKSCTYGRVPNAIDISQGSLTCPSYTDTGPTFLYGDSDTPHL